MEALSRRPSLLQLAIVATCSSALATADHRDVAQPVHDPEVLKVVAPRYPEIARRAIDAKTREPIGGEVLVEAELAQDGVVATTRVIRGHPLLTFEAQEAVQRWQFGRTGVRTITLTCRFRSLPACSKPETSALFIPPFTVEVAAARLLPIVHDSPEPTCPPIELAESP